MIDHEKVEQAVRLLLEGIGEDVNREGLIDTPDRIARMYEEIYGGMEEDAATHLSKTFTVDSSEMVVEKDITFYSTCEHHLMPFYGKANIAYNSKWKSCWNKQACKNSGSFCKTIADSGTNDKSDSRCY